MKVLSNVSKLLVVAALTVNGVAVYAEEAPQQSQSNSALSVALPLQQAKIAQLEAQMKALISTRAQIDALSELLQSAQETASGWDMIISGTYLTNTLSAVILIPSVGTAAIRAVSPAQKIGKGISSKGLKATIVISGVVFASGILADFKASQVLHLSNGQKQKADSKIASAQEVMKTQQLAIVELSKDLGAKTSVQVIQGIPDGVKVLGTQAMSLIQSQQ